MSIFIVCLFFIVNYGASSWDLVTDEKCKSSDYNELRSVLLKGRGLLQEKAKCFAGFSMVGNFWTFFWDGVVKWLEKNALSWVLVFFHRVKELHCTMNFRREALWLSIDDRDCVRKIMKRHIRFLKGLYGKLLLGGI
jgi:hypothetical protein